MLKRQDISSIMNSMVPITRFNQGEASKIFDEVDKSGYKIVVKNNKPACILVSPEKYEEMLELIEDAKLFMEAEKRMKNATESNILSREEVLKRHGLTNEDIENAEDVEIE